ncbi:MAG: cytochrome P450 [Pseudomonadales bacterium]|nr:cytochrome P450 [Pseudomonadales bacterium]
MNKQDLLNPKFMADDNSMYELFDFLRLNDPVTYVEHPDYLPFWSLSKYEDIKDIGHRNDEFLSGPRTVLVRKKVEDMFEAKLGTRNGGENLIHMDRPKHLKMRRVTRDWFLPRNMDKISGSIEQVAKEYVDKLEQLGGECDFVSEIALHYPLRIISTILGLPQEDERYLLKITQEIFGNSDAELRRGKSLNDNLAVVMDLYAYFGEVIEDRKKNPTDDLSSVIANAEVDGEPMPLIDQLNYFIVVATAGHDTTASAISGGLRALIENPEQMQIWSRESDLDQRGAKEIIRWVSPVRHMVRTATKDFVLRGNKIKAGDNIVLWFPAANRDEAVINDANSFQIMRDPKMNLAFGYGAHMCLGQHLATREVQLFFKELLSRLKTVSMNGSPKGIRANFVGGLKSLPITYGF